LVVWGGGDIDNKMVVGLCVLFPYNNIASVK
jgi:hypothetical protein